MGLRHRLYLLARRTITFRQWEDYYGEILERGEEFQNECLNALLEYARRHVPYYSRVLGKTDTLHDIPILTKDRVGESFEELKSENLKRYRWYLNSSGGSTGRPQTFVQDKTFQQWSIASQTYYYRQVLGMEYSNTSKVVLWGSERDLFSWSAGLKPRLSNWLTQTTMLNAFKMSEEDMLSCIHVINRKKPAFIKGYAGSLYQLAATARAHNLELHTPRIVYSSAETLAPFMRQEIEEAFGCKVYDYYGSREVGAIAGECARGSMHIFDFNNVVEVVGASGRPLSPGDEGRLLITNLHNYSMPLIRYEIGDTAVQGGDCDCGSTLPTLERVTGRVTDHFLTAAGEIVHGEYFTHLFYFRDWVAQFQVLQTDVDRIEVYYVARATVEEADVEDINEKIRLVMGEDCAIEWTPVSEIPRTPQGKLLYTRSLVSPSRNSGGVDRRRPGWTGNVDEQRPG